MVNKNLQNMEHPWSNNYSVCIKYFPRNCLPSHHLQLANNIHHLEHKLSKHKVTIWYWPNCICVNVVPFDEIVNQFPFHPSPNKSYKFKIEKYNLYMYKNRHLSLHIDHNYLLIFTSTGRIIILKNQFLYLLG